MSRQTRMLKDDIQIAEAIIGTLKGLLKERDDKIDELSKVNIRLQETNQDHIRTITDLESDLEDSRATAAGRDCVLQRMEEYMEEQMQRMLEECNKNEDLQQELAASKELLAEKVSQLNLLAEQAARAAR